MGSESTFTLSIHGVTLAGIAGILFLMLKQHKIWVRMKDRLDSLWKEYCTAHKIDFKPIENGKSE